MLQRLGPVITAAGRLPHSVVATRVLRRIGIGGPWLRRQDFLHMADTSRPMKAPTILCDSIDQAGLDGGVLFKGIRDGVLMEVGCGRHIGFAPLAHVLGAFKYIGIDPALDLQLLGHDSVRRRYLEPALEAARLFAADRLPGMKTDKAASTDDMNSFTAKISLRRDGVTESIDGNDAADVCVSISCLEHISDLASAAQSLAQASKSNTIHAHLVNFSSHLSKEEPFLQLYDRTFEAFSKSWNGIINGLRLPAVENVFSEAGLPLKGIVLDSDKSYLPPSIDQSWLAANSREVLSIRTALLTNLPPAAE